MTGKDPGVLGFTGFRNRADRSYDRLSIVSSRSVAEPILWEVLSERGKQVVVLGVPQTYPPQAVNGVLVSGFLAPSTESNYTHPPELKAEISRVVGDYLLDVPEFRTEDKARLREDLWRMTEKRFALARHLARTRPWDFFMMVEMGTDRVHHGFWKCMDPAHPRHEPGNPWERVIEEYYAYVDGQVAGLLSEMPDDVTVMVVSDHGATCLQGGICVNEWLLQKGYLVLEERPTAPTRFDRLKVDWTRTTAWGEGGYYGRIFLNVKGREPKGTIEPEEYQSVRDHLARELAEIPDPEGRPLCTRVLKPEEVYQKVNGIAPDLMVYFGDLRWRSVGTVGGGAVHTRENDTGPDDANHDFHGIFLLSGPGVTARGERDGLNILDVFPTALSLLGESVPEGVQGRVVEWR
jgi:predicted AlkP superfamily phosphohydrolase/phosphomutase